KPRARNQPAEDYRRSRKQSAADNPNARDRQCFDCQCSQCAFVTRKNESPYRGETERQSFQRAQVCAFKPAQHRGPTALTRLSNALVSQLAPMDTGTPVVLDVISIVEQQQIVERAVMADRAVRVLVMTLHKA